MERRPSYQLQNPSEDRSIVIAIESEVAREVVGDVRHSDPMHIFSLYDSYKVSELVLRRAFLPEDGDGY
jgi:hypothetical protein